MSLCPIARLGYGLLPTTGRLYFLFDWETPGESGNKRYHRQDYGEQGSLTAITSQPRSILQQTTLPVFRRALLAKDL